MYIKSGTSTWKNTAALYIKSSASVWNRVRQGYIKASSTVWKRFFNEQSLPTISVLPSIRKANTGTGTIYDGPVADSYQYLNDDLFGKDGLYGNYTSITGRKFSSADTIDSPTRTTVVFDDRFTSAGGVTTSMRLGLDEDYLFYEVQVNNGTGDDFINPVSSAVKLIKNYPVVTSGEWTEAEAVGTQLNFNYVLENYYYNRIEPDSSYIRWWRSTSINAVGTLLKEETISSTTTGTPSSTSRSGTSSYTPTSSDIGYYIVAEIVVASSYTRHNGYTNGSSIYSHPTDGTIGSALTFSNVMVKDYFNQKGLDNRDRWPTGTLNQYTGQLSGYDSNTVLRIRYRIYNLDTGLYWKPSTGTQTTASSAWDSWNSDGSGNGFISNVSVSGDVATFYDYFDLYSSPFDGGGTPTWNLEVELSAIRNGSRVYYVNPYQAINISKRIDPTVSVSSSTVAPNTNVTISGTFAGFPATPSTNAYPRQYIVYYGDGTDSGYLPVGEWSFGTLNPTYSLTKSYSTTGTKDIVVRSVPYGESATTSVTVSTTKVPPTMGAPTISASGAFVSGQRRLSVPFTAVTNSGPSYQIYWYPGENYLGNAKPPVNASIDGSGTTSPIIDETGPTSIGRYAVWIRSSATNSTTGTTAPSTTLSDWSDLQYAYISGTRSLSYNKNTTDTVTSLPSNTSGTDPWDGWVTTVSSNTPTRDGHTFNGYNTAANGSGTDYAAGASITLTSDVTLYAKWTANTYSVTYDGNGNTGGSVPDSQTKTHGVSLTLRTNVNSLTKTNYSFSGWNTNAAGTGTDYASGGTYTGNANLTLYAKWTSTATAPGAPTSPSMGASTVTKELSTSLVRLTNTSKDQYWDLNVRATFTMSWTGGSGATSHEIYYSTSSTAPTASTGADYTGLTTSKEDYWDYSTATTYYYWVRARNDNGVSAWVSLGSKSIPALSVTSFSIRIWRGNGTSSTSATPAYTNYYYGWTGLTSRGNPAIGGEGHYATVTATLNGGSALTAQSLTV